MEGREYVTSDSHKVVTHMLILPTAPVASLILLILLIPHERERENEDTTEKIVRLESE